MVSVKNGEFVRGGLEETFSHDAAPGSCPTIYIDLIYIDQVCEDAIVLQVTGTNKECE